VSIAPIRCYRPSSAALRCHDPGRLALAGSVTTAAPNRPTTPFCRRPSARNRSGRSRAMARGVERYHHLAALRLIEAEELGVTAAMPTTWQNHDAGGPAPARQRRRSRSRLGLDNKWMLRAIKSVGNYARSLSAMSQGEPAQSRSRPQRDLDQRRPDVRDSVQVARGASVAGGMNTPATTRPCEAKS